MMCSTYAWRSNEFPFSSRDRLLTIAGGQSIRAHSGQNRGYSQKDLPPELATVAKDSKSAKATGGRSGGSGTSQQSDSPPDLVLSIQVWRHRSVQKRPDLGRRRGDPLRRCDVEPDQPRITAQPGFLVANVAVRIN